MKLLVHVCCGPCAVYPVSVLQKENIEIEGLFFNPNIHPYDEFLRRRENVRLFSELKNIPVTFMDDFRQEVWENWNDTHGDSSLMLTAPVDEHETAPVTEQRCNMCYRVRLDKTASIAKEKGFNAFTTTLLVSPYQKHELICELGRQAAQKYDTDFYYSDFRLGFRQGQQGAKEMGLYRQKYCGCIVSKGYTVLRLK